MAYVKNDPAWVNGGAPGISAERLNHMETQYDESKADLDAKMHQTTGHKHTGAAGDAPKVDADKVDGCDAGTGANNVLKLDASGKVPVGNLPGAGTFNFASEAPYGGTALTRNQVSTGNATWWSVGPTGSGAAIIWTALDAVPAGAKGVRLNLYAHANLVSGAAIMAKLRRLGSAIDPAPAIYVQTWDTTFKRYAHNTVDVQLDSSRRFDFFWDKATYTDADLSLQVYLEGWYA